MIKFHTFSLNVSLDVPKMHNFSTVINFQKSPSAGGTPPPAPLLIFNLGDLKLHALAKLCFLNWLWRNQTSKNQLRRHFSDVIVITPPKTSQHFYILDPSHSKFLATSVSKHHPLALILPFIKILIVFVKVSKWQKRTFEQLKTLYFIACCNIL